MDKLRTYSELTILESRNDRYEYLKLNGIVGNDTFGFGRWLNQIFYKLPEWLSVRDIVIIRDNGCDLGLPGYKIKGSVYVHHINPITKEEVLRALESGDLGDLINPEYLICTSDLTHKAIHYGNVDSLQKDLIIRTRNDTCPWKLNNDRRLNNG